MLCFGEENDCFSTELYILGIFHVLDFVLQEGTLTFYLEKKLEVLYCQGVFYFKAIKLIVKQIKTEYIKS